MGRELVARSEETALGLRICVVLKQALRHAPPPRIARLLGLPIEEAMPAQDLRGVAKPSACAAAPTDRKHASSPPLEPPWPVGDAADRARNYLAQHGIGDPATVPQARCYAVCRTIVMEASGALADENLSHVTEALARQLGRADGGKDLQARLMRVAIDRASSDGQHDAQAVALVSGALRAFSGDPGAADAAFKAMARRAFAGTFSAFQLHARQPGREDWLYNAAHLHRAMGALAIAAGGSRMHPASFQALIGVIDDMLPYAGTGPGHPVRTEDLALVLRHMAQEAGGAALPAALRKLAMAQVCSPGRPYPAALRGAMVYQLGMVLRLWEQSPAFQRALLAEIAGATGLGSDEVGTMAWALGLHLLGNPVRQGWHKTYEHVVDDSTAPGAAVVMALNRLSDAGLSERLEDGLMAVAPWAVVEAGETLDARASPEGEVPLSLPPVSALAD